MSILKSTIGVALLVAVAGSGFYGGTVYGKKTAPQIRLYDLKTNKFATLELKNDVDLYTASPEGGQAGVLVQKSKDGKKILIFPAGMAMEILGAPQEQPSQPQEQPQADHERLDHARNL